MNSILLNPQLYGWQHLTYLAIYFVILVASIILTKLYIKTDKQKTILLKSVAGVLLIFILMNRISIAVKYNNIASFIPNTYCGTTSLLLSLFVLFGKPELKAYHFLFYMGLVGGIATMFYPDFLGQDASFFYIPTISGLLHHSVLLLLCILLLQTKWFTPDLKKWKYFPIGFCCYVIYGLFIMDIFNLDNAMEINGSLIEGTPLNWWFLLIVGSALLFVALYSIELIKKYKNKKLNAKTNENENN